MARRMGRPVAAGRIGASWPKSLHSPRTVAPRIDGKNASDGLKRIRICGMVAASWSLEISNVEFANHIITERQDERKRSAAAFDDWTNRRIRAY